MGSALKGARIAPLIRDVLLIVNQKPVRLSQTLEPLEEAREKLQIMDGLDHKNADGGKDGAGDHARGNGVFLTGVRL